MRQETIKHVADVSAGVAGATGIGTSFVAFLDIHAAGLGVLLTFIFGCIYVFFHWLSYKKSTQADKNTEDIKKLDSKLDEHIETSSKNHQEILDALSNR